MARNARHEADTLIDEMSRLPLKKQPRWFKEMFKNWVTGVSTSGDYSSPEGIPDSETEDAAPAPDVHENVGSDLSDESFDDTFDDESEVNVDVEVDADAVLEED